MNKKLNTAVFFVVASIVNLLIVSLIVAVLFGAWIFLVARWVPGPTTLLALVLIVVASLAASFPVYRRLMVWFQKKVDMEKYFDPIVKLPPRGR